MRQYATSALRRLWWSAAIPTILHISLVSSLVIRQSQPATNQTIPPEVLSAGNELQNCATAVLIPVLQFIITNFVAHAFTALVFPCFGLLTACRSMENLTLLEKDPLNRALEAGALCTVARTEKWKPEEGDVILLPQKEPSEKEKTPTDDNQTQRPLTAMYCKEEGLEGLQQRYIKVHGFCRLPRAHAHGSGTGKEKCNCYRHARSGTGLEEDGKCNCCNLSRLADCPEEALRKKQLLHCQKGQYMLVRLPPHCKVKWNDRDRFHDELTRFHAKQRLGLIERLTKRLFRKNASTQAGSGASTIKDQGQSNGGNALKESKTDAKEPEVDAISVVEAAKSAKDNTGADDKQPEADAKRSDTDAKKAIASAKRTDADAKRTEAKARRAEADAKMAEAYAGEAEANAKKVEVEVKKAEVDAKKAEIDAINAEEDAKSAEDDATNAGADATDAGADAKKAKANAKKAEADAKRAEANARKAEAEAKKAEANSKKAEADAKNAETKAKNAEYDARKAEAEAAHNAYISTYDLGIAGSQNLIKSFVALVQLFSIIQILRAVKVHDYGAYQLTLIPYALMSLVNVVSGFLTPSYAAVYMVDSTVMREARERGGMFDGVIGQLDEDEDDQTMRKIKAKGDELETKSPGKNDSERWGRRKRPYSMISFGDFYGENNDVFRIAGYFHHLGRSFPLLRLLKDPFLLERLGRNNFHSLMSKEHPKDTNDNTNDNTSGKKKRVEKIMSSQHIFQALFEKSRKVDPATKYLAVLEIGNVKHTPPVNSLLAFFMDVVIIIALAIPYVTIHALTGFNAPSGQDRVHGIVFMLWLAIGELLPFFLMPSWNLINLEIRRVALNWRIFIGFLCTCVFTMAALTGFVFVGEMRYRDLTEHNTNCTLARNDLTGLHLN